ncbi:MAG: Holliday junction resolvase RuvX [Planctomycetota bacterium]
MDFGTKRMGLAISDPEGQIVSPIKVIDVGPTMETCARTILEVAGEYQASIIVIGLPLNMDGTEGAQAKLSRALADELRKAGAPEVHLHDERLTSHAADKLLSQRELTHKKKKARHDAVAAQILLKSFLETRPPQET